MANKGKEQEAQTTVDPAFGAAHLPYMSEALALNPLLANQAAAMAAATAVGLSLANQMAVSFLGAWQSSLENFQRQQAAQSAPKPAATATVSEELVAAGAAAPQSAAPVAEKPKATTSRSSSSALSRGPKAATKAVAVKKAKKAVSAAPVAKVVAQPEPAPSPVKKTRGRPKASAKPVAAPVADDLKRVSGIGPKLESTLQGMGIKGFADIAAWTEKDIARFDKELGFEGRITRDDWVGQAKALLK